MREIVLDTETTGLSPEDGHRIVEIGAVELSNHLPTGKVYHCYIDPERTMPQEAFEVHGLGDAFLKGKPVFAAVAQDLMDFVAEDRLVIHNAAFDMRFLNFELGLAKRPPIPDAQAVDTLMLARRKFPGASNSLDALCKRFGIDNSARSKHGALMDAELLAEVYLDLIGGRQQGLELEAADRPGGGSPGNDAPAPARLAPLAPRITPEEEAAHEAFIDGLGEAAIWRTRRGGVS